MLSNTLRCEKNLYYLYFFWPIPIIIVRSKTPDFLFYKNRGKMLSLCRAWLKLLTKFSWKGHARRDSKVRIFRYAKHIFYLHRWKDNKTFSEMRSLIRKRLLKVSFFLQKICVVLSFCEASQGCRPTSCKHAVLRLWLKFLLRQRHWRCRAAVRHALLRNFRRGLQGFSASTLL